MPAAIDHPTIIRENISFTTARYSHPSAVGMYVMSAPHDTFGPAGLKSLPGTFSATGRRCRESVVGTNRLGVLARIPADLRSSAAVFSEQSCPRAFNSAAILGLPFFQTVAFESLARVSMPWSNSAADCAELDQGIDTPDVAAPKTEASEELSARNDDLVAALRRWWAR